MRLVVTAIHMGLNVFTWSLIWEGISPSVYQKLDEVVTEVWFALTFIQLAFEYDLGKELWFSFRL